MITEQTDREAHQQIPPVVCYPVETLATPDLKLLRQFRAENVEKCEELLVPPRDARCFHVPKGGFFRITSIEGSQVGDLNLWHVDDINEKFYSGKTRALHGTHVSEGHQLWSSFPFLRPMATIVEDTLSWYGIDQYGGSVHDVIGTRCDPYTNYLLSGRHYHHCCHSNLTRAFSRYLERSLQELEGYVHDVLNVFMCTGFTRDTGQYFMKASPARPGDYLEFFAEIALIGGLSACPGGDCSSGHSSDLAKCFPLFVEIFAPKVGADFTRWAQPEPNGYDMTHGLSLDD